MSDDKIVITGKMILTALVLLAVVMGSLYFLFAVDLTPVEEETHEEDGEETPTGYMIAGEEVIENEATDFIDCLEEGGLTVYGAETCPACGQLAESLGGYEIVDPIWVECLEEPERCNNEKVRGYVPEIHFNGELYEGDRSPSSLAHEAGCELP